MPEMIEPIGKDRVPFFNLTENPKVWVDDFLKMKSAQVELKKINAEIEKVRKAPRAKSDLKKIVKYAYKEHKENIAKELAGALSQYGNAFDRLPHLLNNPINSYIPIEIVEQALELVPEPEGALTDEQKKKKLESLQKKKDEQIEIIKICSPQAYFVLKDGSIKCDSRVEFVQFWENKQAWLARPCGPQCEDLEFSSDDVKWLHKRLKIGACILSKAVKLPYRP